MSAHFPSFERIDYSLRTNKNIERKLIFDRLQALSPVLDFKPYRYLGFGSLWFVDFVLAHRMLGIENLCSMERTNSAARAEFNKPYFCVEVRSGDSGKLLSAMPPEEWQTPQVAWLDYDGRFDAEARDDCKLVLERSHVGSVLIVTANAHRGSYRRGPVETAPPTVESLRDLLGDSVPTELPKGSKLDVSESDFPTFLGESIASFMAGAVRNSGRQTDDMPDRFIQLFEYVHRDGVPMITVGGVVASWRMLEQFEKHFGKTATQLFTGEGAHKDVLDMVPVTIKEKLALDGLLPCSDVDIQGRVDKAGIKLELEQIKKYRKLYPYFPLFGEMGF